MLPQARSELLTHDGRTALAVVLFHGLTNNPAQFSAFAPLLHSHGVNVFVPRMPLHGDRDRLTESIAEISAEMLIAVARESVEIATGLGERVAALGISMGGLLTAYLGQFYPIHRAVPVAPSFALLKLPYGFSRLIERVGLALPNRFVCGIRACARANRR